MRNKKINVVFKQTLKAFLTEVMGSCDSMIKGIDKSNTYEELETCLEDNVYAIARKLDYRCDECEDKEDVICGLNQENDSLEYRVAGSYKPLSLWDEEKLEYFLQYKDNFTPSELESLLK